MGITRAVFHAEGIWPKFSDWLKMIYRGVNNWRAVFLIKTEGMLSGVRETEFFIFTIDCNISRWVIGFYTVQPSWSTQHFFVSPYTLFIIYIHLRSIHHITTSSFVNLLTWIETCDATIVTGSNRQQYRWRHIVTIVLSTFWIFLCTLFLSFSLSFLVFPFKLFFTSCFSIQHCNLSFAVVSLFCCF